MGRSTTKSTEGKGVKVINAVQSWELTVRRHLEHLSTSRLGLQVQLRPEYGRSLGRIGGLGADLDLVLGDVLIQAGQEVLRQVVSPVDAPVVAYELVAGHLFGHLNACDRFWSVIGAPLV